MKTYSLTIQNKAIEHICYFPGCYFLGSATPLTFESVVNN